MKQALITLSENSSRVLNIVKAKYNLNDKSQAVEQIIQHYIQCKEEPDLRPEFIERIKNAEKGKFVEKIVWGHKY